jgi:hypothetical protein
VWGTENKVDTPEQCCAQCAAYKPQHEDDIYCNGAPFSGVPATQRPLDNCLHVMHCIVIRMCTGCY